MHSERLECPPALTPTVAYVADVRGTWFVARVKGRTEKAFARELIRRGISYYMPLVEVPGQSGRTKYWTKTPYFDGYVAVCGNEFVPSEVYGVGMATGGMCRTVEIRNQSLFRRQLTIVEKTLAEKPRMERAVGIVIGKRCRITAGAYRGYEGIVLRRHGGGMTIVLNIEAMGQFADDLEIDAKYVEPVE